MSGFKSDFLRILEERGFIYQGTNLEELDQRCLKGSITGYIGFDATAKSLQVGNLSAIMTLRWMQKTGHRPIVLVGGGTSRIGDPSFRNTARPIMTLETIQENIKGISKVFSKLIHFEAQKAFMLNNEDWLGSINYIDFLRDFGCHFTVNRMLSFESVKTRLDKEEPLSFLEFNYMILQAYDFYHLNKEYGCILQMGGSDQWGNIVNGVELTRRLSQTDVFGLTSPLVTNANGVKMGKTVDGAIWLNPDMKSPYDYWQFWRNTDDRDVIRFLKKYTELSLSEIDKLAKLKGQEINEAKKILADEATALLHGKEILPQIHTTAESLFSAAPGDISSIPAIHLDPKKLPVLLSDVFVTAGLCPSRSEFKRSVQNKAISFHGEQISDPNRQVTLSDFEGTKEVVISFGKKKHVRLISEA